MPKRPVCGGEVVAKKTSVVKLQRRKTGEIVQGCDVYIGRRLAMGGWNLPASKWANPYSLKDCGGSVDEAVRRYEEYLMHGEGVWLLDDLEELRGKVLGCWCKKKPTNPCHGDVLVRLLNEHADDESREKNGPLPGTSKTQDFTYEKDDAKKKSTPAQK